MRNTLGLLLIVLLPPIMTAAQTQPGVQSRPLVCTHVTVIDTAGGPTKSDATVIIQGNRIIALGKTGQVRVPKDAKVVNASGKFMIPGLWDMHFHSPEEKQAREIFLPLALANGITGVREMFGSEILLKRKAEIISGALLAG